MLKTRILKTLSDYHMLQEGDLVLVGVSGGADSMALLSLLWSLTENLNFKLQVAHLNHALRGDEADEDLLFVKNFAASLGVPFISEKIDVSLFAAQHKLSLEDAARKCRYDFFLRTASSIGATKIALGHTQDDNLETLLMWLLRGCGLQGLSGIPPVRENIIRPLIDISRREVEAYCARLKILPRQDKTNFDTDIFRNRIRQELIPLLEDYNPQIREGLVHSIKLFDLDNTYLKKEVKKRAVQMMKIKEGVLEVELAEFLQNEKELYPRLLRDFIKEVRGSLKDVSYKHIFMILAMIHSRANHGLSFELQILKDLYLKGMPKKILISREEFKKEVLLKYEYELEYPGSIFLSELDLQINASIVFKSEVEITDDPLVAELDYDKLSAPIKVRNLKEGDVFVPLGMKGRKKVSDFFIDKKVSLVERKKVPVLESGGKIMWLVGHRIDDRFKVDKNTEKVLVLKVKEKRVDV